MSSIFMKRSYLLLRMLADLERRKNLVFYALLVGINFRIKRYAQQMTLKVVTCQSVLHVYVCSNFQKILIIFQLFPEIMRSSHSELIID